MIESKKKAENPVIHFGPVTLDDIAGDYKTVQSRLAGDTDDVDELHIEGDRYRSVETFLRGDGTKEVREELGKVTLSDEALISTIEERCFVDGQEEDDDVMISESTTIGYYVDGEIIEYFCTPKREGNALIFASEKMEHVQTTYRLENGRVTKTLVSKINFRAVDKDYEGTYEVDGNRYIMDFPGNTEHFLEIDGMIFIVYFRKVK